MENEEVTASVKECEHHGDVQQDITEFWLAGILEESSELAVKLTRRMSRGRVREPVEVSVPPHGVAGSMGRHMPFSRCGFSPGRMPKDKQNRRVRAKRVVSKKKVCGVTEPTHHTGQVFQAFEISQGVGLRCVSRRCKRGFLSSLSIQDRSTGPGLQVSYKTMNRVTATVDRMLSLAVGGNFAGCGPNSQASWAHTSNYVIVPANPVVLQHKQGRGQEFFVVKGNISLDNSAFGLFFDFRNST
mgnify:CR=1 FL=1